MEEAQLHPEIPRVPSRRISRFRQLIEMLVLLALIVPSSVLASSTYQQEHITFQLVAWATLARDLALVLLILFFAWRNRESLSLIGWRFRGMEFVWGLLLFLPFLFLTIGVEAMFHLMGLGGPPRTIPSFLIPRTASDIALAVVLVIIVAIAEETIFRGYLLLRLRNLGASIAVALIISSTIFALGHGYEGASGMATVGVMGFLFGLIYLWRGSLIAPIVMHFLQDFIGLIITPHLS